MADMVHTRLLRVRSLLVPFFVAGLIVAPGAWQAPSSQAAQAQPPASGSIPGVRNFTKVDSTIACGGALTLEAYGALRQAGYKSVVNLRLATEPGVNIDEAKKAGESVGLVYIHLPFSNAAPDAIVLDEFLKAVAKPENLPMMLHCGSGTRVSMFWAVKRVMIDGWTVEKAMGELPDLSKNLAQPVRTFMLDYLKAHGKIRP
jgi:uncharacterized protein (TIGR01244 family)